MDVFGVGELSEVIDAALLGLAPRQRTEAGLDLARFCWVTRQLTAEDLRPLAPGTLGTHLALASDADVLERVDVRFDAMTRRLTVAADIEVPDIVDPQAAFERVERRIGHRLDVCRRESVIEVSTGATLERPEDLSPTTVRSLAEVVVMLLPRARESAS